MHPFGGCQRHQTHTLGSRPSCRRSRRTRRRPAAAGRPAAAAPAPGTPRPGPPALQGGTMMAKQVDNGLSRAPASWTEDARKRTALMSHSRQELETHRVGSHLLPRSLGSRAGCCRWPRAGRRTGTPASSRKKLQRAPEATGMLPPQHSPPMHASMENTWQSISAVHSGCKLVHTRQLACLGAAGQGFSADDERAARRVNDRRREHANKWADVAAGQVGRRHGVCQLLLPHDLQCVTMQQDCCLIRWRLDARFPVNLPASAPT